MANKPRLLVLSHVLPFPRRSGQQQRVYSKLRALRDSFHLTFLTFAPAQKVKSTQEELLSLCDDAIVLEARYSKNLVSRLWHQIFGNVHGLRSGLKFSNYLIGNLEFHSARVASAVANKQIDCVLYEYWHAAQTVSIFHAKGIPCVLDMHNVLWQSYSRQLSAKTGIPEWWKQFAIRQYQRSEEATWASFDALIAINKAEQEYARSVVPEKQFFYAPMGTDLSLWSYSWEPATPPRIGYYGGLSSSHNQQDALTCYNDIMPHIWEKYSDAELWLVGSNPPSFIQELAKDSRVIVTGYVETVQDVLKTMTVVVCPWAGTYGFRSRLIEVMGLGVPIVATSDAVYGMDMEDNQGIYILDGNRKLADACVSLLDDKTLAKQQSQRARAQVEAKYSFESTYGHLAKELLTFTLQQQNRELTSSAIFNETL